MLWSEASIADYTIACDCMGSMSTHGCTVGGDMCLCLSESMVSLQPFPTVINLKLLGIQTVWDYNYSSCCEWLGNSRILPTYWSARIPPPVGPGKPANSWSLEPILLIGLGTLPYSASGTPPLFWSLEPLSSIALEEAPPTSWPSGIPTSCWSLGIPPSHPLPMPPNHSYPLEFFTLHSVFNNECFWSWTGLSSMKISYACLTNWLFWVIR